MTDPQRVTDLLSAAGEIRTLCEQFAMPLGPRAQFRDIADKLQAVAQQIRDEAKERAA